MKLLSEQLSKNSLEWLVPGRDELPECVVDESLVATSTRTIDLGSEPIQQIVVEADGDPRLSMRRRRDRTSAPGTEVVFLSHGHSP
jgi:hypothetical protein